MSNADDRFEIHTFDPYSGWESWDHAFTRQEAWRYVKDHPRQTLMVFKIGGDLVFEQGNVDDDLHAAWVQRTPF